MTQDLTEIIDATWPAAKIHHAGGFDIREGLGGGSRVSCATLAVPLEQADIAQAEARHRALGQTPRFMLRPGDDALDACLAERGYESYDPVWLWQAPIAQVQGEIPPVTAFAHWPPLQIARDLWSEMENGPERQAIMARVAGPRACILGRKKDRAAGAAFVALHGSVAMLHALAVAPEFRRLGLARAIVHEAARWAQESGATRFEMIVTQVNDASNGLARRLGMTQRAAYHYRREPTQ
ncbi:Acetyltransferase (GNAT) family protein [Thioclava dalianensis]|nr:GNAT family N-acetyltransferase [Thioclava dalianensis]SFM94400.1 Acetyltransferase (GNAT) family protein [Thioclava dalianensis]